MEYGSRTLLFPDHEQVVRIESMPETTRITRLAAALAPLRDVPTAKLTVLAVARPERGKVCVAGIDEHGAWLRPQYVYDAEMPAAALTSTSGGTP